MSTSVVRASDVMDTEVLHIDGMASAREAAAKMRSAQATELMVAKRSDDDAWGIVTIMDLVKNVLVPEKDADKVFVYEIMSKPVVTVPARMDIRYLLRLMMRIGVRRAPVEDQGEIVGMIKLYSLILKHEVL